MSYLRDEIAGFSDEVVEWRRHLHANPETGFEEFKTSDFVAAKLAGFGLDVHRGIAGTGVVGVLRGRRGDGPAIGLRADMDALDIAEENSFSYISTKSGKMHACGHDGHTAMLLGAAKALAADADFKGTVNFIFQPAEEKLGGGRLMIEDGLFERFPCEQVFAVHNWPELPLGVAAARAGAVMASSDTVRIVVVGKGCHAAMPHLGIDPVPIACEILIAAQQLVSRATDPTDSVVISFPIIKGGTLENVIPATAELAGTVRTISANTRVRIEEQLCRLACSIAEAHGAEAIVEYTKAYPVAVNTGTEVDIAQRVLGKVLGNADKVRGSENASMGSEDFAYMLEERPGCYAWIGQRDADHQIGVHNPRYDFNDAVIPVGVAYWCELVNTMLRAN